MPAGPSGPTRSCTARSRAPIEPVLNIAAYQAADPDPYNNPIEDPAETNPFGLAALKSNDVLLADAGNDIIRIKPDGRVDRRPLPATAGQDRQGRRPDPAAQAAGRGRADQHRHRA